MELRTMETQRMLDALTDHLAIYHRSSATKTESRARHIVVEWMASLNFEQRRAVLTVVDGPWVAILLRMQKHLIAEGAGAFILLPDVPATGRENASGVTKGTRNGKGRQDESTGKGTRSSKLSGSKGSEGSLSAGGKRAGKDCTQCALAPPELCYRRARGLVRRLEIKQTSGNLLVDNIRLFSSGDGGKGSRLTSVDTECAVDCVTVTEEFIVNLPTFLEIMDELSHHEFLKSPCVSAASPWEEMPWLKAMGYYSLPAFIANKFEFGLWSAWSHAQGTKKPPRSIAVKLKDTRNGSMARIYSCDFHGNAGMASSVFGRKQGCMDWWNKLESKEKSRMVTGMLAVAIKSEVLKIVGGVRAANKANNLERRDINMSVLRDSGITKLRRSLSDSEFEQHVRDGTRKELGQVAAPYFTGLQALKELSESGLLSAKFEDVNSAEATNTSWLFDSKLKSVNTLSDRVIRKVRNGLVKARNDHVELELLGGENSGNCNRGMGAENNEVKVSKTRKKRRKQSMKQKPAVSKAEEKTCTSKPNQCKDQGKEQQQGSCLGYTQVKACGSDVEHAVSGLESTLGSKQHVGCNGKFGKPAVEMNDLSHQHQKLDSRKPTMDDKDFGQHPMDNMDCSFESLENGKGHSDDCSGYANCDDNSLDSIASCHVHFKSSVQRGDHETKNISSKSSSVSHVVQLKPCEFEYISSPLEDLFSSRKTVQGSDTDEIPSMNLASSGDLVTDTVARDTNQERLSSHHTALPFVQEQCNNIPDCPVSIQDTSDYRNQLDDGDLDKIENNVPVPRLEAADLLSAKEHISDCDTQKCILEPSMICFGTVDPALPELQKTTSFSGLTKPPVKAMAPRLSSNGLSNQEQRAIEVSPMDVKPVSSALNGLSRHTKTSRQLDYSSSRQSHYQQGRAFRSVPHEWPGSPQFGYFGAYHQRTATDWLQLDVGWGWPQRMESPLLTYRSAPLLRQQSGQADSLTQRTIAGRPSSVIKVDMPTFTHSGYNMTPAVGYPIASKEESRLHVRTKLNASPFPSGYGELEANGTGPIVDKFDIEDRLAYDTDVDDYGIYSTGEFDDSDGYMVSEEEGERYLEDAVESNSGDYNQIFGGGVMYWNAADYAGLGYSRPGSQSSEDSSWARHEAGLSAVLDDIVNYQPLQGSYPGKGSTSSNVPSCSPSPPSSSSVPMTFEHMSPVGSLNPRHCLPRPTVKDFSGKFVQLSNQGLTAEEQSVGARAPITLEVIEQIRADSSARPILRPIVVVRDLSLPRQFSSGEALRLQEAKSPHIVPRSRRDLPGHRKRPPSPVLRCVPPAPPPPPPSPVAGLRRRKGLMAARSGSSSPRHWGLVNCYKEDSEGSEGRPIGENLEGISSTGRRRGSITSTPPMHPLSGALLRERLVAIPPLSLEQEHPDVSIPMKTTMLHNSNPSLHLGLTKLLSALHVEIDTFSQQVATENKMRKPFINMAVKKVAHSLQVLWPRSRINIFGSIATGLALPTSDVDLVVCLPPVRNLEPIKEAGILEGRNGIKETSLQHAARYLADQDWVKNDSMKTIENTPVPIIMMVAEFLPHQFEIGDEDIPYSFGPNIRKETCEEGARVENRMVPLLSHSVDCKESIALVTSDEKGPWGGKEARHLVHLDISFETPSHTGLPTAELVRELVGQYPALSPLALVLKQFLTDRSLDHPYTGGLSSYCLVLLITRFLQHQHHHSKPSSNQNLGRLFMDFLHFFGCVFDPRRMGVRIRGGGMYVSRGYHNIDPLYIEDPLHPDNNVGRNCFRILQCVKAFADGYAILEKKLHELSTAPEDLLKGAACLELLQLILPCIMTK